MGISKRTITSKETRSIDYGCCKKSPRPMLNFTSYDFISPKFPTKKLGKRIARPKPATPRNTKKTEFIFVSPLPKTSLEIFMKKILNICCLACDVILVSNLIGEANVLMKDKQIDHIWKHFESRIIKKIDVIEPDW